MKTIPGLRLVWGVALAFGVPFAVLAGESAINEAPNANKSVWTQNVTQFRKEHAVEGGYTKRWDLSDLPHYQPKLQLQGRLRIWGNNYIKDGHLAEYWREAFNEFQPGIEIEYNLPTTGIGIPSLSAKVSDIAMSNRTAEVVSSNLIGSTKKIKEL